MRNAEIRARLRQLEDVTLDELERRMERRWQAVALAEVRQTPTYRLQQLYDDYLHALDDYQFKKRNG